MKKGRGKGGAEKYPSEKKAQGVLRVIRNGRLKGRPRQPQPRKKLGEPDCLSLSEKKKRTRKRKRPRIKNPETTSERRRREISHHPRKVERKGPDALKNEKPG